MDWRRPRPAVVAVSKQSHLWRAPIGAGRARRRSSVGRSSKLVLLVAVGCGAVSFSCDAKSAGRVDRAHGVPILASELHGAGTRLGDGFVVPKGAVLAGTPLPADSFVGPVEYRSWRAVLGIGGSPNAVIADLLEQARRSGLPGLPARPYCSREKDQSSCEFSSWAGVGETGSTGRSITARVASRRDGNALGEVAFLDYGGPDPTGAPEAPASDPVVLARPKNPAPGAVPTTGQNVGFPGATIKVLPRSTMVLPVVNFGAPVAVLRVDGDAERIFQQYVDQVRKAVEPGEGSETIRRNDDGWAVTMTSSLNYRDGGVVELMVHDNRAYIRLKVNIG